MSDFAVESGVPEAGPVAAEAVDSLAGGAAAGEATDGTEAAAPAETGPQFDPLEVQAELEYVRQQNAQLYTLLEQAASGAAPTQAQQQAAGAAGIDVSQLVDEFGNPNMQALAEMIQASNERVLQTMDQRFQQLQAPLVAQAEAERTAFGEERVKDMIADNIARNGEFSADPEADKLARAHVRAIADQLFPEIEARYGATPKAVEFAIDRAAEQVRGLLRANGQAAVNENTNRLGTLASQHGEPGAAGGGAVPAPVVKVGERSADLFART